MKNLIIYTNNFPFETAESFLSEEIVYLAEYFPSTHIVPVFRVSDSLRQIPSNVTFSQPIFKYNFNLHKIRLIFDGLLNLSPIRYFVREALKKSVFFNQKHFLNWLSYTCIHRILLKKKNYEKIVEKIGPDTILYFYWGDKPAGIIPFLRKKYNNPIAARFHGSDLFEEAKSGYIPCRESVLTALSVAIFISQKGENYARSKYPGIHLNSHIFRLGVSFQGKAKASSDGKFRIVSCSNVIKLKRLHLILESLNHCKNQIHWVHFGDGPLMPALKEKAKNASKNLTITFKGLVPSHEIYEFYKNEPVDLFVNVSETEGIPVSIMEAISFGIPIIATDVGGVSEIVGNSLGKLIPKDFSTKELAKIVDEFCMKSKDEIVALKENAFRVWEKSYSAPTNYTRFATFLLSLK